MHVLKHNKHPDKLPLYILAAFFSNIKTNYFGLAEYERDTFGQL